MKVHLMFQDRDFDETAAEPPLSDDLVHDLDLERVFAAMGRSDPLVLTVSRLGVLSSLSSPEEIEFRQEVLADCLTNSEVVRDLYNLAASVFSERRRLYWYYRQTSPTSIMAQTPRIVSMYVDYLKRFRAIVDARGAGFGSTGWTTLFSVLRIELSDDYFDEVERLLAAEDQVGGETVLDAVDGITRLAHGVA